jgi:hypothetical protein
MFDKSVADGRGQLDIAAVHDQIRREPGLNSVINSSEGTS